MLNQNNRIDTDETPLATPGPQLEQPDQDDFGFDHLTDTPQKLKDASYEIEIAGHLNASMHGASPPPKMPKGKYKYQTFGACIAYIWKKHCRLRCLEISIPPLSFKPVSLFLSRSFSKSTQTSLFLTL